MTSIGLISDSHGPIPEDVLTHLKACDEVWHAGDIGPIDLIQYIPSHQKLRAVYGNIDGLDNRRQWPEYQCFSVEGLKCLMIHIGGYPPKYSKQVRSMLNDHQPDLYTCGHSHILKIMPDKSRRLLHMNPGACGHKGFHSLRTMILFDIDRGKVSNVRVVELGKRGRIS